MKKEKLLIVEDDPRWISNYKRWLGSNPFDFDIDAVDNAETALRLLISNYYAVVLLDLSLHPEHPHDRSSEEIQKFVRNKSEGTKHIIVSTHADKMDIQTAAYTYKAFDTFFKEQFEDLNPFLECVKRALQESKKERPDFLKEAYDLFIGSQNRLLVEHNILANFKPEGSVAGWFSFKEKFFETISPLASHKAKNQIVVTDEYIVGLFWSRSIGKAISIVIGGKNLTEAKAIEAVTSFLGWSNEISEIVDNKGIKGYYFEEPDLNPEDFDL